MEQYSVLHLSVPLVSFSTTLLCCVIFLPREKENKGWKQGNWKHGLPFIVPTLPSPWAYWKKPRCEFLRDFMLFYFSTKQKLRRSVSTHC